MKKLLLTTLASLAALATTGAFAAEETVKVGVLHSLSGTMAISETSLKDVLLFTFDEINAKGGVLGKKIEPVIVDPASNWPLFAEKAEQLLVKDKVAVVFGCWTSVSRKSVLPVFEKENGLLFYPVQYEGEELSKNIFYTAEAVNQQAIPAVDYMLADSQEIFEIQGHSGRGHCGNLYTVRAYGLSNHRCGDQKVFRRREGLRHQHLERRYQRAVLQRIRERRPYFGKLPGGILQFVRRRVSKSSDQGPGRASGMLDVFYVPRHAREQDLRERFQEMAPHRSVRS
jgi:hypothetical protein